MENSRGGLAGFRGPTFLPTNLRLWFNLLENSFDEAGIVEEKSKFVFVSTCLDRRHLEEVEDILTNPPATDKYESLKQALIARLCQTDDERTEQLLAREEMGDRTPSKYLRYVRSLAATYIPERLIKFIWWSRLPADLRAILAGRDDESLDQLATSADAIFKQQTRTQATKLGAKPVPTNDASAITEALNKLTIAVTEAMLVRKPELNEVNVLTKNRNYHPTTGSTQRARGLKRSSHEGWCWYHQEFGANARRCRSPCKFKSRKRTSPVTARSTDHRHSTSRQEDRKANGVIDAISRVEEVMVNRLEPSPNDSLPSLSQQEGRTFPQAPTSSDRTTRQRQMDGNTTSSAELVHGEPVRWPSAYLSASQYPESNDDTANDKHSSIKTWKHHRRQPKPIYFIPRAPKQHQQLAVPSSREETPPAARSPSISMRARTPTSSAPVTTRSGRTSRPVNKYHAADP